MKVKNYININILFFLYSLTSVLGKFASREKEINIRFLLFYGGSLLVMGIYALCWQQIIKKIPLMVAYANKAIVIIWGVVWGCLFFDEYLTIGKITGIILIIIGVVLFSSSESEDIV